MEGFALPSGFSCVQARRSMAKSGAWTNMQMYVNKGCLAVCKACSAQPLSHEELHSASAGTLFKGLSFACTCRGEKPRAGKMEAVSLVKVNFLMRRSDDCEGERGVQLALTFMEYF